MPDSTPPAESPRKPRAAARNLLPGLQVDQRDTRWHPVSWRDFLWEVRKSGSSGFLVSLVIHAVVLGILAFWIIDIPTRASLDPVIASWLDLSKTPAATKGPRKAISLPMTIASVPSEKAPPKPPTPNPTESAAEVPALQPAKLTQSLEQRALAQRNETAAIEQLGGSSDAQRAIKNGLAWLARQQTSEGKWEHHTLDVSTEFQRRWRETYRTATGSTAMALLCFLGAGQTAAEGEYTKVVASGLKWLVNQQDPETGDLHDMRQEEGRAPAFYAHSAATMALCEALVLTGDETLRPAAEKAVRYLVAAQHPQFGGWKYRPINKTMVGDLSVTTCALLALHSARMAGIDVALEDFQRASGFLDSVQVEGGARYKFEPLSPPDAVDNARTAEGLLCRQWFGWPNDYPPMILGTRYLLEDRFKPEWTSGRRHVYAWYFTAQVLHNRGGPDWERWYLPTRDLIVKHQLTSGSAKPGNDVRGSWHPKPPEGALGEGAEMGGRLYLTALCILFLETPYRYPPLFPPATKSVRAE